MERYSNLGRNSGIIGYKSAFDSITVFFEDGTAYLYDHRSAGIGNINHMKELALAGRGLNSFINKHVRKNYARRMR
jgi:hypothetical protein